LQHADLMAVGLCLGYDGSRDRGGGYTSHCHKGHEMTSATAAARRDFDHLTVRDQAILNEIRRTYAETYYRAEDAPFLLTPAGQGDLDFNAFVRYNQSIRHALPWVDRVMPLEGEADSRSRLRDGIEHCGVREGRGGSSHLRRRSARTRHGASQV
jgi:hypothetical protein